MCFPLILSITMIGEIFDMTANGEDLFLSKRKVY